MIIQQTREAIRFFSLAIKNAQQQLDFTVGQDKQYQDFQEKYKKLGYTILFYNHIQEFSFYTYVGDKTEYFIIKDGEIIYDENNTLFGREDIANELLDIVKKFY